MKQTQTMIKKVIPVDKRLIKTATTVFLPDSLKTQSTEGQQTSTNKTKTNEKK